MPPPDTDWNEVWAFFMRHLDDIRSALPPGPDRFDVAHDFVLSRLPGVVAAVAQLPEDGSRRYVRASVRNFARSHHLRAQRERAALAAMAELTPPTMKREHAAAAIARVESTLDPLARRVLRAHFGLDGPAMSLRDIARAERVSRHAAARVVIDALTAAAIELGAHDEAGERLVAGCRAVLIDGLAIAAAAAAFGVTTEALRRALTDARALAERAVKETK